MTKLPRAVRGGLGRRLQLRISGELIVRSQFVGNQVLRLHNTEIEID